MCSRMCLHVQVASSSVEGAWASSVAATEAADGAAAAFSSVSVSVEGSVEGMAMMTTLTSIHPAPISVSACGISLKKIICAR